MLFFRRLSFVAACTIASVLVPASAGAATYFVDPAGSDASAGTSEAQPWKTVGKVNGKTLAPGDVVLLKGGARFGTMLEPRGSGTAEAPITFGSYGTGRALLDPVGGGSGWAGIALSSGQSHLRFEHLEIAHWGAGNSGVYIGGAVAPPQLRRPVRPRRAQRVPGRAAEHRLLREHHELPHRLAAAQHRLDRHQPHARTPITGPSAGRRSPTRATPASSTSGTTTPTTG